MGRLYSVTFENVAVAAAQDLIYVAPADDKPLKVHALYLANLTEVGDAAEEQVRIVVRRGHTTVGSGGGAFTPIPLAPSDTAAGFTARINDTTVATAGTGVNLHADGWNVRLPYMLVLPPELRLPVTQVQGSIVVRLLAAPVDSITMSGTLYVEEDG